MANQSTNDNNKGGGNVDSTKDNTNDKAEHRRDGGDTDMNLNGDSDTEDSDVTE